MARVQQLEQRAETLKNNGLDYASRLAKARKNFEVKAPTQAIADKVCDTLAIQWMQSRHDGITLPTPCTVRVKVGQVGAGGATTFSFKNGRAYGYDMTVQGSLEDICDSVIPHELCHVLNAEDTGRPLPRWGDEGSATLAEAASERRKQLILAKEIVGTNRFIPIRELLAITEYPKNMQHVLVLYAEGAALSDFLISRVAYAYSSQLTQEEARQWMVGFMNVVHERGVDAALNDFWNEERRPFGNIRNVAELSNEFTKWLKNGKADIYAFKEVPIVTGQGLILPVKYSNDGVGRVVPAN